ncbi:MAG: leucine-rich repeat domain-containing protein, partial [Mycoplasmoidaceae bacterium]|nr:leucine-rich repeat domain-containing protein [Mycoplasmoidaceae bacterium]
TILTGFTEEFINDSSAYSACDTMQIPTNVVSIADNAFFVSSGAGSSTIPSFIKNLIFGENSNCSSIGAYAFYKCTSLTFVTLPDALLIINNYTFYGCSALTSVVFPDKLTTIGAYSFEACSVLTSITFSNSLSEIGACAFATCLLLSSVDFSNCSNLTTIGLNAFQNSGITTVNLEKCIKLTNILG